jgi:hypothetical protein
MASLDPIADYPSAAYWERQREQAGNWAANIRCVLRASKRNYAQTGTIAALGFYQQMQRQYTQLLATTELWISRCNAELAIMPAAERDRAWAECQGRQEEG